jgi:hypothetical protein
MAYLLEKRGSGLLVLRGKEYDHGHLPPLLEVVMAVSSKEEEFCSSYP